MDYDAAWVYVCGTGIAFVDCSDLKYTYGTPITDLAGYNLYYGTASGNYTQNINVGNVTTYTTSNLATGTYYFVATAYNTAGKESAYSNQVTKIVTMQYTLTITDNGTGAGKVTSSPAGINCGTVCSEAVNAGSVVTLTAAPTSPATFTGWSGGGCTGTGTCSFTLNANTSVTATFVVSAYAITATAGTGGAITPSGNTTVNSGGSQTYTITPSAGYSVGSVTVDGASVGAPPFTYTFSNVTATHTITATFNVNTRLTVAETSFSANNLTVILVDNSTGGSSITVNWGDSSAVSIGNAGGTFTHTYTAANTYTVVHTATLQGVSARDNLSVTVPAKFTVSGTVTNKAGSPLSSVSLALNINGLTKGLTSTDSNGKYTFVNVVPGAYSITAIKNGYTFANPAANNVQVSTGNLAGVAISSSN